MRLRNSATPAVAQPLDGAPLQPFTTLGDLLPLIRNRADPSRTGASLVTILGVDADIATVTITADLAVLAARAEIRTLLVDANLDHAAHDRLFGVPNDAGVADILAGKAAASDAVRTTASGVALITTGSPSLHADGLFDGHLLMRRLQTVSDRYDLVLIDARSIGQLAAGTLAAGTDHTLVVVRRHQSSMRELHALLAEIPGVIDPLVLLAD